MANDSKQAAARRILIIDDHPLFREGVKAIVRRTTDYAVVAEAGTFEEGMAAAREHAPDLAIVDLILPENNGVALTGQLLQEIPGLRVLVISMTTRAEQIAAAFKMGATGFLNKNSAPEELIPALDATSEGQPYLDGSVSRNVALELLTLQQGGGNGSAVTLTPREQEIMRLLASDLSTKEIAERLFISPRTVENHRSNLMHKLGLKSPIAFLRYAVRHGLVDL